MWPGYWPFSFEVMVTEGDILFQCGIVRGGVGWGEEFSGYNCMSGIYYIELCVMIWLF